MSEAELVDMEECSEMFDFTGFSPEDDKHLLAEVRRLRKQLDQMETHVRNCLQAIEMLAEAD